MSSTYTTRLRLEKQATGENSNTWGDRVNTNVLSLVDQAVGGYTTIALTSSTVTLSVENGSIDQARAAMIELTGVLTSNVGVVIPSVSKQYLVRNATSGSFTVTFKTLGGSGTAVTQGNPSMIYCDGASVRGATGGAASRNIGTSVTEIPDISIADERYVKIAGDTTITGGKTFTSAVCVTGSFKNTGAATFTSTVNIDNTVDVSGAARGTIITLTDAASIIVSMALGNTFVVTLGGNRVLNTPAQAKAGQSGLIYIYQDGTGSRTMSYGAGWKFSGGTAPTLTTTASAVDLLSFSVRTSTAIDAELKTNFS